MLKNYSKYRFIIFTAAVFLFSASALFSQNALSKISNRLSERILTIKANETELVWIFFTDKGKSLNKYFEKPSSVVSPRSLARRAKYYKDRPLIDETDIPVNQGYIEQVEKLGVKVKHKTKWFNGISAYVKKKDIEKIAVLSFVKKIDLVRKFKVNRDIEKPKKINSLPNNLLKLNSINAFNYGFSAAALNQLNIPALQNQGFTGTGITIAVMDAGFSNLSHEVFSNMKIIAKWDFVNNDSVVADQPLPDSGSGSHGTYTLSIIGGFKDGKLIGPAFDANFILAKTENTQSESPIEEDNWLAAAEWADSIGVDVTSTSLGYRDGFDFGFTDYTAADMNGKTTIITKAADMLASKGVVVVNAAGNEGTRLALQQNSLVAPADGDSVIAVGAVTTSGVLASFSSRGPTADGRIKPDVVATGVGVYFANGTPGATTGYFSGSGTSFSCPLTAGVAALILQKHPAWNPMQVREALRMTASNASSPNNNIGWGIINALAASNYSPTAIDDNKNVVPKDFSLDQNYPNPFNPTTRIRYQVKTAGFVSLKVFNILGNKVATLVNREKPAGTFETQFNAEINGRTLPSGVYFYRLTIGDFVSTKKMILAK
ncbi:MAG TPA: T9SS type A sorting domain-containing protein [Ignavibacteria bacterium]|nr:T9SS type A sorting domain-containing protein [Ignavibacteria bacterium]